MFQEPGARFFISRLAIVEVYSSLARLVREGLLNGSDFGNLTLRLEDDVASGVLMVAAMSGRRLEGASSILSSHGLTITVRTLDAIHLATAQALNGRGRIAAFVAADKRLLAVATACGLTTLDVG